MSSTAVTAIAKIRLPQDLDAIGAWIREKIPVFFRNPFGRMEIERAATLPFLNVHQENSGILVECRVFLHLLH
jgi:hypothetical protein